MKTTKLIYTDTEIQDFINRSDPELLYESLSEFVDPDEVEFENLVEVYNRKHFNKYRCKLMIQLS